jgi:hypothetical protein
LIFGDLSDLMVQDFVVNNDMYTSAKDIKDHFDRLRIGTINDKYNKFIKEFGVVYNEDSETYEITNFQKLQEVLVNEVKSRQYGKNTEDIIKLVKIDPTKSDSDLNNYRFNIPLYFSPKSLQFESLLNSLVVNAIIKEKLSGKSFVQGSSNMFNRKAFGKDQLQTIESLDFNAREKITWVLEQKETLSYMGWDNNTNSAVAMEVLLPNKYRKQFPDGNIPADLLRTFGFRIPNQGHNSMAYIQIAGFLPEESGDLVIVPYEFLVSSGSDFDVDKLYIYFSNVDDNGNRVKYLTEDNSSLEERYTNKIKELKQTSIKLLSGNLYEGKKQLQKELSDVREKIRAEVSSDVYINSVMDEIDVLEKSKINK